MKGNLTTKLLTAATTAALLSAAQAGAQTMSMTNLELGLTGGYASGLSGEVFVHAPNVIGPVGIKAGVAYSKANAINDAAPFDPSGVIYPTTYTIANAKADGLIIGESGSYTVFSVDGTYSLGELTPGMNAMLYAGGRYGMFSGTETYGTNQYATYSSNPFGIGGGVMLGYALTGNLSLIGDLGADYFLKTDIKQFQNTGTSTETNTYKRSDADYATYDNRFVRPGTVFKARIGIKYTF